MVPVTENGHQKLDETAAGGAPVAPRPSAVEPPEYAETGEMSTEQKQVADWIVDQTNEFTREGKFEKWKANIMANRPYFTKGNPPLAGITAILVGAGPSLEKNIHLLKNVSARAIIICVEAALRFVLGRGIKPEYVISIDGSEKMLEMVKDCDTNGITLVCTPSVSPELVSYWKGPIFFVTTPHVGLEKKYNSFHRTRVVKAKKDIKAGDDMFLDEEYEVAFGGIDDLIVSGGNVSTAGHDFAFRMLQAQRVILVGMDLSWKYESHHYAGHEHQANVRARTEVMPMGHKDQNGDEVLTNFGLMQFKRFHEQMARQMPGTVINASEGGILGIGEKGVRNPFVEFLTLGEALAKYGLVPESAAVNA